MNRSYGLRIMMTVAATALIAGITIVQAGADLRPGVKARMADTFVDSIGVNTHWHYGGTPYRDQATRAAELLVDSGIRHQRDYPWNMDQIKRLAGQGIRTSAIVPHPDQGSWAATINAKALDNIASAPGAFASVEGINEPDITMGSDWASKARSLQQTIWNRVKGDASLRHLPVAGPSITWAHNAAELGNIGSWADWGNVHPYPGGRTPDKRVGDDVAASQRYNVGGKPVIATETGYHTQVPSDTGHPGIDEAGEAVYLPRLYLHYFDIGVPRTYSYEFIDQHSSGGAESRFGLLRHDLSPKPAYHAVKNLITLLSDPGPAFSPGELDYEVVDGDTATRHVLLQKRDGTFWLALWQETPVWNERNGSKLQPVRRQVRVELGDGAAVDVYRPNSGTGVVRSHAGVSSVTLESSELVTLLEIQVTGAAEPEATTTTTPTTTTAAPTTTTPPTTAAPTTTAPPTTEPPTTTAPPPTTAPPTTTPPTTAPQTTGLSALTHTNVIPQPSSGLESGLKGTIWNSRSRRGSLDLTSATQALHGDRSLLSTNGKRSSSNFDPWQSTVHRDRWLRVDPGGTYTFAGAIRLPDGDARVRAIIEWLDDRGRLIGRAAIGDAVPVGDRATWVGVTANVPAGAAGARVFHRVDSMPANGRVIGDAFVLVAPN